MGTDWSWRPKHTARSEQLSSLLTEGAKLTFVELQDPSSTTTQGRGREEIDFVLDHARYIKIVKGQQLKSMRHQGLTGDLSF